MIVLIIVSMYREHGKNSAGRARPDSLVLRRGWGAVRRRSRDSTGSCCLPTAPGPGMPYPFLAPSAPGNVPPKAGPAAAPRADLSIHPGIIPRGISFLPAADVTLKIPPRTQFTHTVTSGAIPSCEPRQNQKVWFSPLVDVIQEWCFLLKTADFESLYVSPETAIFERLYQRNPGTWTLKVFPSRHPHWSTLGLFCNLSLIRKCWKYLILAGHQRQWSCMWTELFIMWLCCVAIYNPNLCCYWVAIMLLLPPPLFFFFWKLVYKCV